MHCMLISQLTALLLTLRECFKVVGIATTATINEFLTLIACGVVEITWKICFAKSSFRFKGAHN